MRGDAHDEEYRQICDTLTRRFHDVQVYTDTAANSNLRFTILVGGLGQPNPRAYMDNVVDEFVRGRGYNQFIDEHRDNPYVRIIIEGINNNDILWTNQL